MPSAPLLPPELLLATDDQVKFSEILGAVATKVPIAPIRLSWFAKLDDHHRSWPQAVDALIAKVQAWAVRTHTAIFRITITTHRPLEGGMLGAEANVLAVQMPTGEDTVELQKLLTQGRRGQRQIIIQTYTPLY